MDQLVALVPSEADASASRLSSFASRCVRAMSWNIAAVNNNPFEYWITNPDPSYDELMKGVQLFLEDSKNDVSVEEIFTQEMFSDLFIEMNSVRIDGLAALQKLWRDDFCKRKVISGFLMDRAIGNKRFVSMPDRITSTVNLKDGSTRKRPTVINASDGGMLDSTANWWEQWKNFMFHTPVVITSSDGSCPELVCGLIGPISRSKYPVLTLEEQAISIPLQIMCLAILDAVFIHMMTSVAPGMWESVRQELCEALINRKSTKIRHIIAQSYSDVDIIFIQEAAAVFVQEADEIKDIKKNFAIVFPSNLDGKRDQNSLIMLSREYFQEGTCLDVTERIVDALHGQWVAPGDLIVVSVQDVSGARWLLASFHGDSNGLSTQPVVEAIDLFARTRFRDHILVMGLDANTHSNPDAGPTHPTVYPVDTFREFIANRKMVSCWGQYTDENISTTCGSRTYLQTQLHKATPINERSSSLKQNLRDWILTYQCQTLDTSLVSRDNTGAKAYVEGMVLPTLDFPSDHTIISACYLLRQGSDTNSQGDDCGFYAESHATQDLKTVAAVYGSNDLLAMQTESESGLAHNDRTEIPQIPHTRPFRERTLLDYWGICDKPAAVVELASHINVFDALLPETNSRSDEGHKVMDVEHKIERLMAQYFVKTATRTTDDTLDREDFSALSSSDRSIWMIYCSRPISMICCKRVGQILLIFTSMLYILEAVLNLQSVVETSTLSAQHVRFTALERRSASSDVVLDPGISGLGLLVNGCAIHKPHNASLLGPAFAISFDEQIPLNGWYFTTGSGSVADDPKRFAIELSRDGTSWRSIEPPPWLLKSTLSRVPEARLARKMVDLRPSWQWLTHWVAAPLVLAVANLLACLCGIFTFGRKAALVLWVAELLVACINLVIGLHNAIAGTDDEQAVAIYYFLMFIELGFLSFMIFTEEHPFGTPFVCAIPLTHLCFGPTIFMERLSYHPNTFSQYIHIWWSTFFLVILVALLFARHTLQKWVLGAVSGQREQYDSAWRDVLSDKEMETSIRRIHDYSQAICQTLKSSAPRQRHHDWNSSPSDSIWWHFIGSKNRSTDSASPPMTSLDQLLSQAACLDVFLRDKTEQLALISSGLLSTIDNAQTKGLHLVEEIRQRSELSINWARLKSAERALEKMMRSYHYDASRLLDCCRQRIIFADPQQMLRCLEAILQDGELEVVRLKNRLSACYDSRPSAGFRNVTLNLRIHSDYSKRLGIDTHVCELQLTLKSFHELMDDEKHAMYLIARGARTIPSIWTIIYKRSVTMAEYGWKWVATNTRFHKHNAIIPSFGESQVSVVVQNPSADNESDILAEVSALSDKNERKRAHGVKRSEVIEVDLSNLDFANEKRRALEHHFVISTTRNRTNGHGKDHVLKEATLQTPLGSIWDISHPVAAALSKPRALVFIMLLELLLFVNFGLDLWLIMQNNVKFGYHFRFTNLEHQEQSKPLAVPGIIRMGLLMDGCGERMLRIPSNTSIVGPAYTVSFSDRVAMNGWWISTKMQPISDRPVRFLLEHSDDIQGLVWHTAGASSSQWSWSGAQYLHIGQYLAGHNSFYEIDDIEETSVYHNIFVFDMRYPKSLAASKILQNLIYVIACGGLIVAGVRSETLKGRWILATCFCVKSFCEICFCVIFRLQGYYELFFVSCMFSIIFGGLSFVFVNMAAKVYLRHWAGIAGAGQLLTLVIHFDVMLGEKAGMLQNLGLFRNGGFTEGMLFILFSLVTSLLRMRSRKRANKIVEQDQVVYENLWKAVLEADSQVGAVEKLNHCAREIQSKLHTNIRQRGRPSSGYRRKSSAEILRLSSGSSEDRARKSAGAVGPLILDLDQLFAQAAGLNPFLKRKVQEWALRSKGCFPVMTYGGKHTFERWEVIVQEKAMLEMVRWATPKKLKRAVEKLYRVYDCDVSKLLDCCRQSIYFEDLDSLALCLMEIAQDVEIELVRINNRLHPSYDSKLSAGYRDVSLNLCINCADTRELGIETHICELQLIHVEFAKIKTEEGHKNYVSWRNQRGA